jgi:hypothetical protein
MNRKKSKKPRNGIYQKTVPVPYIKPNAFTPSE